MDLFKFLVNSQNGIKFLTAKDTTGKTGFMHACKSGNLKLIHLMIEYDFSGEVADLVNARDAKGRSGLDLAWKGNEITIIQKSHNSFC